jgi:hypothetical protein
MAEYVYPELARHLKERSDVKAKGYGTPLKTNNGRNPLVDAYHELLDSILYQEQRLINDVHKVYPPVSDTYWFTEEPSPIDNGGCIVIDSVLTDLRDVEFFITERVYAADLLIFRDTIRLAERMRIRIERDKNTRKNI